MKRPGLNIRRARRLSRSRAGNAMLEFAIGSGLFVAAFVGTFEFGYAFVQYNNLESAVERGAHYAAIVPYDSGDCAGTTASCTSTPSTAFSTAVKNMVLYGSPTAGTSPVVTGLTASNINLTVIFTNGVPSTMMVDISGYSINAVFATIPLTHKPQVTYNYQGIWSPI